MRMRRKKHREERLENCASIVVSDLLEYKDDITRIFSEDKPLHMEIGCGKGRFMTNLAAQNPDINYIAFEKNLDVIVLAAEKVYAAGLKNVRFVPGDAGILSQLECENVIDRLYINFCDPWHKKAHAKRRLTHKNYLDVYKKILKNGGELHFKTDNTPLFEFSLNSFAAYGLRLKNITLDLHKSDFEGNIMTEYEEKFYQSQPIYRCEAIFE